MPYFQGFILILKLFTGDLALSMVDLKIEMRFATVEEDLFLEVDTLD